MVGLMEVRLFGELEAEQAGVPMPVRGTKQRALLALLALQPGQPVSADRLIELLWSDGQAANPANAFRPRSASCAALSGRARSSPPKPAMPSRSALMRSTSSVSSSWWRRDGRLAEVGHGADASAALGKALGLRRGEPLAEFTYAGFADTERTQLDELTLVAIESRAGADLMLGRHGELVGELEAPCREHPLRQRLWELLMLALYQAGRQAEALSAYTEVRDRLVSELGIDPGRPCGNSRPGSWPRIRHSPQPARQVRAVPAPMATGNLRERLSSFVGRARN